MSLDDQRVAEQEAEVEKLSATQDEVEAVFRKANRANGSIHLSYESDVRAENLQVTGPLGTVSATASKEEGNLGVWADLGGKGSVNLDLSGIVYNGNASSGPGSILVNSPSINYELDGMLGKWNNTVAVEYYSSDTDLGDFTRGNPEGSLRYEDPFDIKKYSGDKNQKNWDDYITNLTYVPSFTSWSNSNNSQRVFDGLYMVGTSLPLLSKDAKATILVGRVEKDPQKWEEGLKYNQPFLDGHLQVSLSSEWVNDNLGAAPASPTTLAPAVDQKSYEADLGFDLKPFFLDIEGGYSHYTSGLWTPNGGAATLAQGGTSLVNGIINPPALEAPAGQASLNIYPLTFYYTAISDNYVNPQSKVILAGFNLDRYGYGAYVPPADSQFGFVGLPDDLISDRYGWRANLGWKGRQESWMKDWPDFLDDIVVNLDVAQKTEYRVIPDETGNNAMEAYQLVSVYYPEDLGLVGRHLVGVRRGQPHGQKLHEQYRGPAKPTQATPPNTRSFPGGSSTERIPLSCRSTPPRGVIQINSSGYKVYTS